MRTLLAISCLCLAACSTRPPIAEPAFAGRLQNACLPEAAEMAEGLHRAGIQAKVLLITTPAWKHAVCVYLYPSGENRLWVWDSDWKSLCLRAWWTDPAGIAAAWIAAVNQNQPVTDAEFLQ